ncbi:MAG: hypothetical protein HC829_06115 [Bacteroidales bacterium]|nr:hypothetical protein [Bacteroidales bacterium]
MQSAIALVRYRTLRNRRDIGPALRLAFELGLHLSQQRGLRVNVWTVNDPAYAVALRDAGVDAIISDNPDTVLAALHG